MFHLLLYLSLHIISEILNLSNKYGGILQYYSFDVKLRKVYANRVDSIYI